MQQQKHKMGKRQSKLPAGTRSGERGTRGKQVRRAGEGKPEQNAGGPEHRGLDAHEDRNP